MRRIESGGIDPELLTPARWGGHELTDTCEWVEASQPPLSRQVRRELGAQAVGAFAEFLKSPKDEGQEQEGIFDITGHHEGAVIRFTREHISRHVSKTRAYDPHRSVTEFWGVVCGYDDEERRVKALYALPVGDPHALLGFPLGSVDLTMSYVKIGEPVHRRIDQGEKYRIESLEKITNLTVVKKGSGAPEKKGKLFPVRFKPALVPIRVRR